MNYIYVDLTSVTVKMVKTPKEPVLRIITLTRCRCCFDSFCCKTFGSCNNTISETNSTYTC